MQRSAVSADPSARSPFAGCAILITALLVMVFLVLFSILTLFRQYDEIAKFTSDKPSPTGVPALENEEPVLNTLAERIESFRQQLAGEAEVSLALTPAEMNLIIAAYEPFKDLRGTFRIDNAEGDTLRITVSFPLNGKPRLARAGESGWIASDPRYLNATLRAKPALLKRELVLKIEEIVVPGATVPREFIEQMSPYRIAERYLVHPDLGPAMARLTSAGVADGRLVLARKPGETPADTIGEAEVDSAGRRFFTILGVAASLFLAFAGAVILIGLKRKSKDP
jgi:hypothetical protein